MDCSPPGSSVPGILQARILEWVVISSFRGSSGPRDQPQVSYCLLDWQVGSLPLAPPGKPLLECSLMLLHFSYEPSPMLWQETLFSNPTDRFCNFLAIFRFFLKQLKISFLMQTIFKVFNLLQYCFCFRFWHYGWEAWGVLASQPGMKPTPCSLESKVLTTGLPGKSCHF